MQSEPHPRMSNQLDLLIRQPGDKGNVVPEPLPLMTPSHTLRCKVMTVVT